MREAEKKQKMKRFVRTKFSREHVLLMRAVYVHTAVPNAEELSSMAVLMGVDTKVVRIWFQNRRQRNDFESSDEDNLNAIILILDNYEI